MYGLSYSACKVLVRAYRAILKRLASARAMSAAILIGSALPGSAKADVFAGSDRDNRVMGLQRAIFYYYYDAGQPDMYARAGDAGYVNRYQQMVSQMNLFRQFLAVQSGGQFDLNMTYAQIEIASGKVYDAADTREGAKILKDNSPMLYAADSDYLYHMSFVGDTPASITGVNGNGGVGGGDYFWESGMNASILVHEFGHTLGLPHNGSIGQVVDGTKPSAQGYTYDFTNGIYTKATPITAGSQDSESWTQPITNLPIGTYTWVSYNPFNRMAGAAPGAPGVYDPLAKASLGWLNPKHFAKIGDVPSGDTGAPATLKLYDASDLRLAVQGAGDSLRYGVQQGYRDVAYDASLTRVAEIFDQVTGKWMPTKQRLDFYYQGADSHWVDNYPAGEVTMNPPPNGIVVTINHRYVGTLQEGQKIDERTLDMLIANLGDGDDNKTPVTQDYLTLKNEDPRDPRRIRPVHYELTFLNSNNIDASGVFANLQVSSLFDLKPEGAQWDPAGTGNASRDGAGVWRNAGANWRDLTSNNTGNAWSAGGDAVFGAKAGTAGIVTLGDNITASSLTFTPVSAGHYTIAQDAGNAFSLTLGTWGVTAAESATIGSKVIFGADQFWTVSDDKRLDVTGVITTGGFEFYKFGRGTLNLDGANTWDKLLNVAEGAVVQSTTQTFANLAKLALDGGTTYRIENGSLILGISAKVTGEETYTGGSGSALWMGSPAFAGTGVLQLSRTNSTTDSPEIRFRSWSDITANLLLDAGQHVIITETNDATISGNISGSGGINKGGAGRLFLSGGNTFTGVLSVDAGIVLLASSGAIGGHSDLRINTGATLQLGDRLIGKTASVGNLSGPGGTIDTYGTKNGLRTLAVNQTGDGVFAGTLAGEGVGQRQLGLAKSGSATLTLTGNNTYTGGTTISAGTLRVSGAGSIGTGAVTLAGGVFSVNQGSGLTLTKFSGAALDLSPVAGGKYTADFSRLHASDSDWPNTTFAYTGKIYLTAGQWAFGENYDDAVFLKINGVELLNNASYNTPTYNSLNLGASDWYDIDLRVQNAGSTGGPYDGSGWGTKGIGIRQGASSADGTLYTAFNPDALGIRLKDTFVISNDVNLSAASGIEILDTQLVGAETTFTGAFTGTGDLSKTGGGPMVLAGNTNTYSGATFVKTGSFAAGTANAFSPNSAIVLSDTAGATLDLRNFNQTIASLSGGGSSGGNVLLGSATFTTGRDNSSTRYAGVISGTGALIKTGTGTMTLSGQNTYTGATKVTGGGVLALDYSTGAATSGVVASTSALTLDNGSLRVTGRAGATITQTFGGLTVGDGVNRLILEQNGSADLVVNIGTINRIGSGTIDFSGLTGSVAGARVVTTSGLADARLDGGLQWATYNGGDWASRDAWGDIVAYDGYSNVFTGPTGDTTVIQNNALSDIRINEGGVGTNTLSSAHTGAKSLLMSARTTAATVNLTGKTLAVEAVAVGTEAKSLTLGTAANQGVLTSSSGSLLFIANNTPVAPDIVVNAIIANSGATPLSVTVSGGVNGGMTVFAGDNTYTGTTTVTNNGTLQIGAGGTTGRPGFGAVTVTAGATLAFDRSDAANVDNAIGGAGSVRKLGGGTTTLSGANTYSGITYIDAGTLRIRSGTLGAGDIVMATGSNFDYGLSGDQVVRNIVSGAGTFRYSGGGTVSLVADNAYTGGTFIDSGTLHVGTGGTTGSLGSGGIVDNGVLKFDRSDDLTIGNSISGTGGLVKAGGNTLTLSGDNSYAGTTTIESGTLKITGDRQLGTGAVTNNGAILYDVAVPVDTIVGNAIAGSGSLTKSGSGKVTLTGANAYAGTTTVNEGILQVGNGGATGTLGSGEAIIFGTLAFNHAGDTAPVGNIFSGPGGLAFSGTGKTILTGDNSRFVGTATIAAGATLQIGNGGTNGNLSSATIVADGSLIFNRSDDFILTSAIGGAGSVIQSGAGTMIITGSSNNFSGDLVVSLGRKMQVGNDGTTGSLGLGTVSVDGTLSFRRSNEMTVANIISGSGSVTQDGAGTTILTGANTYSGTTIINAGMLQVGSQNALSESFVIINSGGKLGVGNVNQGVYTLANNISLSGGSIILPASQCYVTLNGTLDVDSGANTLTTQFHGGSGNSGGITINGLVSGSGSLTINNFSSTFNAGIVVFNNTANTYSGTITVREAAANANPTNPLLGVGANTALKFATVDLSPVEQSMTDQVVFSSGVVAPVFGGLTGNSLGGISLGSGVNLTVANTTANLFAGRISGAGSLAKSGAGSLSLTGTNTFTGGISAAGGVLDLDFSGAGAPTANILAASNTLHLDGGTVRITGTTGQNGVVQSFAALDVRSGASTLQLVQNGATTLDVSVGAIGLNGGTVNFAGLTGITAGARVLTTSVAGSNNGFTQLSATGAFWNGTDFASVRNSGGVNYVVKWLGGYTDIFTGTAGGATIVPNNTTATVRIIEGGDAGGGNTLAAATTTIDSLLMSAGTTAASVNFATNTLVVGGYANAIANIAVAATAKSLTLGAVANEGFLTAGTAGAAALSLANFNGSSTLAVNAVIKDNAGAGAVSVTTGGPGKVVFGGDNTYTGTTTIGIGNTLQIGAGGTTGALGSGAVTNNGTLSFNRSGAASKSTVTSVISGTGNITKDGGSTVELTAANTYVGITTVNNGTLIISGGSKSSATVVNGGTLELAVSGQAFGNQTSLGGAITVNQGGTLNVTQLWNLGHLSSILVDGGILNVTANNYANNLTLKNGATVTGGGISLGYHSNATVAVSGTSASTASSGFTLARNTNGTDVTFNVSDVTASAASDFTVSGTIIDNSSAGVAGLSVTKAGSGTMVLSGANTYAGATFVNGGTLLLNAANTGTGLVTVASGAGLGGTGSITASVLINSGGVLLGGTGEAASGSLSIKGGVTLASGSVVQLALGAPGEHSAIIISGGTIAFDGFQKFTFLDLGAKVGVYDNLITGAGNSGDASKWIITNGWSGTFSFDGAGNVDLVLTAVPEPSTYGLLGAGALLLAARIRRRRQ